MTARSELLRLEYQAVNDHLRGNIAQFVNWFSSFLTFSFISVAIFAAFRAYGSQRQGFVLRYGVEIVFLLLHILAFTGIIIFRRYLMAAHCKLEEMARAFGEDGGSPIPIRFCQWMTDLMAAGFVVSYFAWFSILLFG